MTVHSAHDRGGDVVDAYLAPDTAPEETDMGTPMRWTDDDRLETNPGVEPVADVSPGDYDAALSTGLWAGTGKSKGKGTGTGTSSVPDPDQLAAARRVADRVRDMQDDPALLEAMPSEEIAEAQRLARQSREAQRQHEHEQAERQRAEQRADDEHDAAMRDKHRKAQRRVRDARERHERASDPSHRVAVLAVLARYLPLAALIPGLISIVLGTANAGTELTRLSPATAVVNWLFEPMLSLGVLVILVAQWWGGVPSALHAVKEAAGKSGIGAKLRAAMGNGFFIAEVGLFLATCVMQVGIHYLGSASPGTAPWVWAIVPTGLLISMGLVPAVSSRLNHALSVAMREAERVLGGAENHGGEPSAEQAENPASTGGDLRGKKHAEDTENSAENLSGSTSRDTITEPAKRSRDEIRGELHRLLDGGEVTVQTPINQVAKKLGTRWATANELMKE